MFINLILASLSKAEITFWIVLLAVFAFASGFLLGHSVNFKHLDREEDEEESDEDDTDTNKGGDNE